MSSALSSSSKNYIVTIYNLSQQNEGENGPNLVRIKDIASSIGVAPPSVVEYVQRLKDQGIVNVFPRKGVTLTKEGIDEAKLLVNRQRIMSCFFENILHIDKDTSNNQAHSIEHLIEPDVIKGLYNHINKEIGCPNEKCNLDNLCTPK